MSGALGTRELAARVEQLLATQERGRVIVGIAGAPGSGKSTVAQRLVHALTVNGVRAVWLPMDGFHLADRVLDLTRARDRKGAIDTFDALGYAALLRRVRHETGNTVYAPEFERDLEQPIAGAIPIEPGTVAVVTEGNYLLADGAGWRRARSQMDEVWFLEAPAELRVERLVRRHIQFGKTPDEARAWVRDVDEQNARLIETRTSRAQLRFAHASDDPPRRRR